jgi:hypothetical protein
MIRLPRRSVTRFFIPMIDVLTVLFCMFLLMPIIQENAAISDPDGIDPQKSPDELRSELLELSREQDRAKTILLELEKKQRQLRQEVLYIKVIDISPKDGSLSYFDAAKPGQPPLQISSREIARALIGQHKKEAEGLKLIYLFTRPFDPAFPHTLQPDQQMMATYRSWFEGVECTGLVTSQPTADKGALR